MQNDILFGIMLTLLINKKSTARELAAKYEMSVRSIYRYLDTLNQAGVPIVTFSGAKGGVAVADNFKLDKTYFTKKEYERILSGLANLDELTDSNENQMLIDKFKAMSQAEEVQYVLQSDRLFVDAPVSESMKNKLSAFRNAVYNCKECEVVYHSRKGEITQRTILPHAFSFKDGQWYVYAYCTKREDFRLFKISRVYSVVVKETEFARKPIPQKILSEEDYSSFENVELSIFVKESCRLDVEEWLGIENVTKSGDQYFASAKQIFNDDLVSKLLSFGDGITIVSPPQVEDAVKQKLMSALKCYK